VQSKSKKKKKKQKGTQMNNGLGSMYEMKGECNTKNEWEGI